MTLNLQEHKDRLHKFTENTQVKQQEAKKYPVYLPWF